MEIALLAILGLFIGGPLNVIIDRLAPHEHVDGLVARGARPRPIRWWEWFPLLSTVGAAKSRRVPYPNFWVRYSLVEISTAAMFGLAWHRLYELPDPLPLWLVAVTLVFISVLIALAYIDLETTFLPDKLVLPLLAMALVVSFFVADRQWWHGLAGAGAGYAVFYPFAWIGDRLNRPVMGWGDVKLAAALGAILGLAPLALALYLGVLIGGAVAIVVYAGRLFGFNRVLIPYGPYLVMGGIVSIFYYRSIIDWVSGRF